MPVDHPRLVMRGIRKTFGPTIALGRVDLEVLPGEVHALVGENGAGKSTLMKILSGAHAPDSGEMEFDGKVYSPRNPLDARGRGVGMIYQELSIAPHLTVEENIVLGMEPSFGPFVDRKTMRARAMEALAHFDHPDLRPDALAGTLSVSALQLVEIGRSLAMGCKLLVFDEPTSSLAQKDIERLFLLIDRLKAQGISIIYISHFLEEVQRLASRLTVLRDGSVVGTRDVATTSPEEIVSLMVGRDVEDLYPRSERTQGAPILEIRNLSGKLKPESASLDLHRGEVVGIAGLVGSGRTEFLRALFGLDTVKSGEIRIGGSSGAASPRKRWQQGIGLLSENRKEEGLALSLSIADNVTLTCLERFGAAGTVSPKKQSAATSGWIQRLGIKCQGPGQAIGGLSGGNQQKAAFARLLEHDVDVLLLDEPTRGIDIAAKARIYEAINEVVTDPQRPRAVIMISSYLPELFGVCDRIAVMSQGRLSRAVPVAEITPHDVMLVATGKSTDL
ncbi:MAG: sugar ABC transporter ATP-binding protein [Luteolibacter sp.]